MAVKRSELADTKAFADSIRSSYAGTKEFVEAMQTMKQRMNEYTSAVLNQVAQEELAQAKSRTPVDTGAIQQSIASSYFDGTFAQREYDRRIASAQPRKPRRKRTPTRVPTPPGGRAIRLDGDV